MWDMALRLTAAPMPTLLVWSTRRTFQPAAGLFKPPTRGAGDAFLTKVNTNAGGASSLIFSTYLGGSGLDQGNGVAVDPTGNAYVAGLTTSRASSLLFTRPPGAFQPDCTLDTLKVCEGDAFVAKVALSGRRP